MFVVDVISYLINHVCNVISNSNFTHFHHRIFLRNQVYIAVVYIVHPTPSQC